MVYKSFDCIDTILWNSVKLIKNRNAELIFLHAWKLHYLDYHKHVDMPLGKRIFLEYGDDFPNTYQNKLLREYYGISFKQLDDVAQVNVDSPMCIKMDTYYCRWNPYYQKYHVPHYFIAVQHTDGGLLCMDTYIRQEPVVFKCEDYSKVEQAFIIVEDEIGRYHDKVKIKHMIRREEGHCYFENIRLFADELLYNPNVLKDIFDISRSDTNLLIRKIKYISDQRYNFIYSLRYLYGESRLMEPILSGYMNIHKLWKKIRMLLIYCKETQSVEKLQTIATLLKSLSEEEEILFQSLKTL